MNSSQFRSTLAAISLFGYLAILSPLAHADLTGETIDVSGLFIAPSSATIGSGIEFIGIAGLVNFDFSDNILTLTPNANTPISWGGFGFYTFSGFTETITGLSIGFNDGFSSGIITNYTFTDHSITLDIMDAGNALPGSSLVFNIATSGNSVSDQSSTIALCGIALAGIGLIRRRCPR